MHRVRVTLSNYRGFSDENPAVFELGGEAGFAAFVGPNNSGKSSLMRFFYEMRQLFEFFVRRNHSPVNYGSNFFLNEQYYDLPFSASGVSDGTEVFSNENKRDMRLVIEILDIFSSDSDLDYLKKIIFCLKFQQQFSIMTELYGCKAHNKLPRPTNVKQGRLPHILNADNVHVNCSKFVETLNIFCDTRYFGSFRNALNEGARDHFDMKIGTNFVTEWDHWKNGGNKDQADRIERVTRDIEKLFHFDRLEINAATDKKTLLVKISGKTYRLEELGSGVAQFIVALGNAAMQSPSLLLIDEPEANLHPSLQLSFLSALASYAREGVVFSTHSLGLARSVANDIYTVQFRDGKRTVRPFSATPHYAEFLGEFSFSAFQDLGGETLLLVEGVNDVKTLHEFLRLLGIEQQVIVFPIGGNQFISSDREQELSEIKRLCNRIFALIDSERKAHRDEPDEKRRNFVDLCQKLGFTTCITHHRAIENYFTDRAVKAALGEKYRALDPWEKLGDVEPAWRKADSWKIARLMTKEELSATEIGEFLVKLSEIVTPR
jgi:energy-coupling factor transporter ATP-binding protein EcfA2